MTSGLSRPSATRDDSAGTSHTSVAPWGGCRRRQGSVPGPRAGVACRGRGGRGRGGGRRGRGGVGGPWGRRPQNGATGTRQAQVGGLIPGENEPVSCSAAPMPLPPAGSALLPLPGPGRGPPSCRASWLQPGPSWTPGVCLSRGGLDVGRGGRSPCQGRAQRTLRASPRGRCERPSAPPAGLGSAAGWRGPGAETESSRALPGPADFKGIPESE